MKVIFLGTPSFAIPALDAILQSSHQLVAVVAQPDRLGSRNKVVYSEVKQWAIAHNIPLHQFAKISTPEGIEAVSSYQPDIMVTAAYGQMLSQAVIDVAKHGIINIHGSLLPHLRGASPIQQSIINGEVSTGVTVLNTVLAMDAGDMICSAPIDIGADETFGSLYERMAQLGGSIIVDALDSIENGSVVYTPQDATLVTKCRKITPAQECIDWSDSASNICNLIRALNPSPIAWTTIGGKRLKVLCAQVSSNSYDMPAGQVAYVDKKTLTISCGVGAVNLIEVKPENGKAMPIVSYLCSRKPAVGTIVGGDE